MKRLFQLLLLSSAAILTVLSCKDDFNEQDFLKLQSELKLKQDSIIRRRDKAETDTLTENTIKEFVAAANAAGDLMAVTLLLREDGNPLPGVAVTMNISTKNSLSSGRESSTQATTTGTTDANGTVTFDKVVIGSGTIMFSKSGYISSTALVDFGVPSMPRQFTMTDPNTGNNITRYLAPEKRFEEGSFQMFSTTPSEGSTATIKGKVTIQNDVTNNAAEVPSNIVIRANLASLFASNTSGFVTSYQLADNTTLGAATVSPTGDYTMTVPATNAGLSTSLIVPNIEGTCKMAVNGYDNGTGSAVAFANGPEYRDVPTSWGPQAPTGFGASIPLIAGAKVVFPQPPAAGTGLTFDFTPVGRSLPISIFDASTTTASDITAKITDRGQYGSGPSPVVEFSSTGGGSGAKLFADMRTYVSAISVINSGANYTGNLTIAIYLTNANQVDVPVGASFNVANVNGGLPSTIDLANLNVLGFSPQAPASLGSNYLGLKLVVTGNNGAGAQVSGTFKTEVKSVSISAAGANYSSKPTFIFKGGNLQDGDPKHADFEITEFGTEWAITVNNSASSDYYLVPASVILNFPATSVSAPTTETTVNLYSFSGVFENAATLASCLSLGGNRIVQKDPARQVRTKFWSSKPSVTVTTVIPKISTAAIFPSQIDPITGKVSGTTNRISGQGYNIAYGATIQPAISTAPGAGGEFGLVHSYNSSTGEYVWDGAAPTIKNPGSGYLPSLNQSSAAGFLPPAPVVVQPGKTYIVNIDYGTGFRKVAVN